MIDVLFSPFTSVIEDESTTFLWLFVGIGLVSLVANSLQFWMFNFTG